MLPGAEPGSTVWEPVADGNGVAFLSAPLTQDMVLLGPAAASIALSSSAADTDLGLTLGEVRPDGTEIRITTGTQRGSMRNVDPARSTPTRPFFTLDAHRPLLPGINQVPVQILPAAHVLRAGSRLRLTIAASVVTVRRGATTRSTPTGARPPTPCTWVVRPRRP